MNELLPEGFHLIPPDHPEGGPRGLRLGGERILATEAGCWVARIRNRETRIPGPRWLWIHEADGRAVMRYRNRAWAASGRTSGDFKLRSFCGHPHCLNPAHLEPVALPKGPPPRTGGQLTWVGDDENEEFRWVPIEEPAVTSAVVHPEPVAIAAGRRKCVTRVPRPSAAPLNHTANRVRGEAHQRAKLTADDVRAIRAATGMTQAALAARYGITAAGIRRILTRKAWAHID